MKDREFMPGEELEGGDDADTAEYETRRSRVYRGQAAARGGRGYWIGPEESDRGTGEAGSGARLLSQRSAAQPRPRHGRRMLLWMGLSLVVLVALVIVAVLVLAGEMVVPGLSAKLFPIHYQAEIARVADDYGQDPYLVAAMVKTESGYDPTAESGAGAVGLMQLMPDTAEWVAARMHKWEDGSGPVLTDPVDSLDLGTWYLDYLGDLYGDGSLAAVAAYNGGLGNVDDWIEVAGGIESFGASDIPFPETREYVERVERYRRLYTRVHSDAFAQAPR
jgi:soluble lytic murein transglycosylase